MALRCCSGGSERAAKAITTALSPDRMMLIQMIFINPIQKSGLCINSMSISDDAIKKSADNVHRRRFTIWTCSLTGYASRQIFIFLT